MAKQETLEFKGKVTELLPNAMFRVKLENNHEILAHTAGKLRKNRIRVLAGDNVMVEMTPYDAAKLAVENGEMHLNFYLSGMMKFRMHALKQTLVMKTCQ